MACAPPTANGKRRGLASDRSRRDPSRPQRRLQARHLRLRRHAGRQLAVVCGEHQRSRRAPRLPPGRCRRARAAARSADTRDPRRAATRGFTAPAVHRRRAGTPSGRTRHLSAALAVREWGADWVLLLDADEILTGRRRNSRRARPHATRYGRAVADGQLPADHRRFRARAQPGTPVASLPDHAAARLESGRAPQPRFARRNHGRQGQPQPPSGRRAVA